MNLLSILAKAIVFAVAIAAQSAFSQLPVEKALKKAKKAKETPVVKNQNIPAAEKQNISVTTPMKTWEWGDEVELKLEGKDGSEDNHWVKGQIDEVKNGKYKVRWESEAGDRMETWVASDALRKAAPREVYRLREELGELKLKLASGSLDAYTFEVYFERATERIQRIKADFPDYDISASQHAWSAVRNDFDAVQKKEKTIAAKQKAEEDKAKQDEINRKKHEEEEELRTGITSKGRDLLAQITSAQKQVEDGSLNMANWNEYAKERESSWVKEAFSKKRRDQVYNNYGSDYYSAQEKAAADQAYQALADVATKKGLVFEEPLPMVYQFTLDEIIKITGEIESYDPQKDAFLVNPHDGIWLLRAVSMKEREKWMKEFFSTGDPDGVKDTYLKKLDHLAMVAKTGIPKFKPNPKNFATRNAAEETLMRKQLDLAKVKIFQIGLAQSNWDIQKNALDIPQKRYKAGYIWGQDSGDDHDYCKLYQVNIIQEYMGGGAYGQSYAVYLENWLTGCP